MDTNFELISNMSYNKIINYPLCYNLNPPFLCNDYTIYLSLEHSTEPIQFYDKHFKPTLHVIPYMNSCTIFKTKLLHKLHPAHVLLKTSLHTIFTNYMPSQFLNIPVGIPVGMSLDDIQNKHKKKSLLSRSLKNLHSYSK